VPTYSYRCNKCGNEFDVRQSFSDEPLKVCEACGGSLRTARTGCDDGVERRGHGSRLR